MPASKEVRKEAECLSLVEKYDIALSFLFGVDKIDAIAKANTYDGVVQATQELMKKQRW